MSCIKSASAALTLLVLWSAAIQPASAIDLTCQTYQDSGGAPVQLHPRAFADAAVCPGREGCANAINEIPGLDNHPDYATGPPNYLRKPRRDRGPGRGGYIDRNGAGYGAVRAPGQRAIYSLGCRGSATWRFTDNVIVDVEGPDIFVFEVGRSKEPTRVELSEDGGTWHDVGLIAGAKASLDIKDRVEPGRAYRFIRLTDLGSSCRSRTAGADIDAIAALAFSWQVVEDDAATVLFASGADVLTEDAKIRLMQSLGEYRELMGYDVRITGHTDWVGNDDDNQKLSERRAEAVRRFLSSDIGIAADEITTGGKGEREPVASNATPQGRSRNRRVELVFAPRAPCP